MQGARTPSAKPKGCAASRFHCHTSRINITVRHAYCSPIALFFVEIDVEHLASYVASSSGDNIATCRRRDGPAPEQKMHHHTGNILIVIDKIHTILGARRHCASMRANDAPGVASRADDELAHARAFFRHISRCREAPRACAPPPISMMMTRIAPPPAAVSFYRASACATRAR